MDPSRTFGFLLKDVSRLTSLNFEREAAGLDLSIAQCKVLIWLQRNQGLSQVRLAELTGTDPMTLVRILDRMEKDGWVERRPDPADRRARRLYMKDEALPVVDEIWRIADRARAAALAGLSSAERDTLISLLGRIHDNLTNLVPDEGKGEPAPTVPVPRKTPARTAKKASK